MAWDLVKKAHPKASRTAHNRTITEGEAAVRHDANYHQRGNNEEKEAFLSE